MKEISLCLFLCCAWQLWAQPNRFSGDYPLATPAANVIERKADYEKTLTAIIGGAKLAGLKETPTSKSDPEALTKQDFKLSIEDMFAYANELSAALQNKHEESLKKAAKLIKSDKMQDAIQILQSNGGANAEDAETQFFIWRDYLIDKKNEAPWLNPANIKANRLYRQVLAYVSKNFERPFGVYAELGAVVSDAAQSLSNCLDYHQELDWKGEGDILMEEKDDLRRLASNVAYLEWRRHEPANGRRSAKVDKTIMQHIQRSLYAIILGMQQDKADWYKLPEHGQNIQTLYADAKLIGWNVDGDRALNSKDKPKNAPASNPNKPLTQTFGW